MFIISAALVMSTTACSDKQMAKYYGGTANVDLPKGQKLINVTWKEDSIWYLTRPMNETDTVETYTFQQDSSFGIFEGTVIIKEHK